MKLRILFSLLFLCILRPYSLFASELVQLKEIDPSIIQEMRYASPHNFIGRPIKGYEAPHCLLTEPAAKALALVQKELKAKGCP